MSVVLVLGLVRLLFVEDFLDTKFPVNDTSRGTRSPLLGPHQPFANVSQITPPLKAIATGLIIARRPVGQGTSTSLPLGTYSTI